MNEGLRQHLLRIAPAPVSGDEKLARLLAEAWASLKGDDGGMQGYKVLKRMENVTWNPPVLTFEIERHGAIMGGGSIYAEMQAWCVDVEAGTKTLAPYSPRRRVRPAQARLDTGGLAADLATLILAGQEDERLQWRDGSVQVRMGNALPAAAKQTTEGRRSRLNDALATHLVPHGWTSTRGGWWAPRA